MEGKTAIRTIVLWRSVPFDLADPGMFASGPEPTDRRNLRKTTSCQPVIDNLPFSTPWWQLSLKMLIPPNRDFHGFRNFTNLAVVRAWSPAMYSKRDAEPPTRNLAGERRPRLGLDRANFNLAPGRGGGVRPTDVQPSARDPPPPPRQSEGPRRRVRRGHENDTRKPSKPLPRLGQLAFAKWANWAMDTERTTQSFVPEVTMTSIEASVSSCLWCSFLSR